MVRVVAVVGVALLVACSSPPAESVPAATLGQQTAPQSPPPSPSPSPSPEAIDTADLPETVDVAYLQAVMDDLDGALGETYREVRQTGAFGEEYLARMHSIYTGQAADVQARGFREAVGLRGLAARPGDPRTEVLEILEMSPAMYPGCVYFTAKRHLNPLLKRKIHPIQPYYIVLGHDAPNEFNPTTWVIASDTWYRSGKPDRGLCRETGS
jgi:hypothetical protein